MKCIYILYTYPNCHFAIIINCHFGCIILFNSLYVFVYLASVVACECAQSLEMQLFHHHPILIILATEIVNKKMEQLVSILLSSLSLFASLGLMLFLKRKFYKEYVCYPC